MFGGKAAKAAKLAAEVGPLGPIVDDAIARAMKMAGLRTSNGVPLQILLAHLVFGLFLCACVFVASAVISPRLFRADMARLKPNERKTWHTNAVTFLPTFAVTYFAAPAVLAYAGPSGSFLHAATADTLRGCGISLGYMTWDLLVMLLDARDQMRAYGGASPYVLFLIHHTLSLAAWPYAVTSGRCVYFVNYFLVSEVTNFNMSLRWFLMKCGKEGGRVYFWNGILWIPLFFTIRIAVIPRLVTAYFAGDWSELGANETWAARLLLPVPILLNVYWFWLIASTAIKFLATGSETGVRKEALETKKDE
jgi:hypothetical protein